MRDCCAWTLAGIRNPGVRLHTVAYCLHGASYGDCDLYVMINAYDEPLDIEVQESPATGWRRAIDTGLDSPFDITEAGEEVPVASLRYRVQPRSTVVLVECQRSCWSSAKART